MELNMTHAQKKKGRLLWLDAARGMAMLFVIIGHTLPGNQTVISALYTFHLPLFFVLSGYASRPVKNWDAYFRRHLRSFFQLIVPCALVQTGLMLYLYLLEGAPGIGRLIGLEKWAVMQLFWAGAAGYNGRPALGIPWFMFTLFWGRGILDAIRLAAKRNASLVCLMAAAAGLLIGQVTYLPQSLDLALVSLLYLFAGDALRRADEAGKRLPVPVWIAAVSVWAFGLVRGVRIDMAVHDYGAYLLGIPVSMCACLVMIALAKKLEQLAPAATKALAYVGRISLYMFFVHHVDDYFMTLWYRENWWLCIANRIALLTLIAAALHTVVCMARRLVRR